MENSKLFYSMPEAAKILGVSQTSLWKNIKSGQIKVFVTPGGHHRIPGEEIKRTLTDINTSSIDHKDRKLILVVDNDHYVRSLLTKILTKMSFITVEAADGFEVAIKSMELIPDLIILDIFMPCIDGFEICRRIRGKKAFSHSKIIAISENGADWIRKKILGLGADIFLKKSRDYSDLINVVTQIL